MNEPLRCFIGFDSRQPLAYNVLQSSLHRHSKARLHVEPLMLDKLPIKRRGLTEFTFSRFAVPYLCGFQGTALFMDADIVVTGDIAELFAEADGVSAVQVMQNQPRFEWASVMLFNCAQCKVLTPEYIDDAQNKLLDLGWGDVGHFSKEWNYCVGYSGEFRHDMKLLHYTQGIPCWQETENDRDSPVWLEARDEMLRTCSWWEIMGQSVHAKPILQRYLKQRYGIGMA